MFNNPFALEDQMELTLRAILKLQNQLKWYKDEVVKLAKKVQELETKANRAYELGDKNLHRQFMGHVALCRKEGNTYWKRALEINNSIEEYKELYRATQERVSRTKTYTNYSYDSYTRFDEWELEEELEGLKRKVSV